MTDIPATTLHRPATLDLVVGWRSLAGQKPHNDDCIGLLMPVGSARMTKGVSALIADGVSSAESAAAAAEYAVEEFLRDYYDTPDSWRTETCARSVLKSINRSLYNRSQNSTDSARGYLCTLSGLVLKSDKAHLFHVGDSRIYRLRNSQLLQLTRDHQVPVGHDRYYLSRALGMDLHLEIDYQALDLFEQDRFLLCTDGISDFLDTEVIATVLRTETEPDQAAARLCELAGQHNSTDNLSCLVLDVQHMAVPNIRQVSAELRRLPFPPTLEPGAVIDGYQLERSLASTSASELYIVRDSETGQEMVLKAPSQRYSDDPEFIDHFLLEEWVGLRINSPNVVRVLPQVRPRTALYYLLEYVPGESLAAFLAREPRPDPALAMDIIRQAAAGLTALHRRETLHRDLKPANLMLTPDGQVKLVDFGAVQVAGIDEIATPLDPDRLLGTDHYSDPRLRLGMSTDVSSDLFSLATICYELFTGQLPYGNALAHCTRTEHLNRLRYIPADRFNPVIPEWFDRALKKALNPDPQHRYRDVESFLRDLTDPNPDLLEPEQPQSAGLTTSLVFWQAMSAIWLISAIFLALAFWLSD